MAKAFDLSFSYSPLWKENRRREPAEQITFRLRDLQTSKRIAEQRRIYDELTSEEKAASAEKDAAAPKAVRDGTQIVLDLQVSRNDLVEKLVFRHIVSFTEFSVIDADGREIPVKTKEELAEHCSDLVAELGSRLLNGPDQEELKNLLRP